MRALARWVSQRDAAQCAVLVGRHVAWRRASGALRVWQDAITAERGQRVQGRRLQLHARLAQEATARRQALRGWAASALRARLQAALRGGRRRHMATWRAAAAERKARAAAAWRAAARLISLDTARALGAWVGATAARRRRRQRSPREAAARRAWRVWTERVASAVAVQHMTWRVAMRLLSVAAARALARWMDVREEAVAARAAEAALQRVGQERWQHRQQAVALRSWASWRATRGAARAAAARGASRRRRRRQAAALASWREDALEAGMRRRVLRESAARAARALAVRRRALALAQWRTAASLVSAHFARVASAHAAARCRAHRARALHTWGEVAGARARSRLVASRAMLGLLQLSMRRALLAWIEAVGTANPKSSADPSPSPYP